MDTRRGACILAMVGLTMLSGVKLSSGSTIRIVSLGRPLPLVIGLEHGDFARQGVQVEIDWEHSSDALRAALAAGRADVAIAAVDNGVAMAVNRGAPIVVVMGGSDSDNELMVQHDIASFAALRGRTVLVDAPNTAFALQLIRILQLHGLQPGRDYRVLSLGETPLRLKAMEHNSSYSASMLWPPTSLLARQLGMHSLGSVSQLLGPYQGMGTFTLRPWAQTHASLLERYLAGYIAATRWLLAPANKAAVVALLEQREKLPAAIAIREYAALKAGGIEPDARIDEAGFRNVLEIRQAVERSWQEAPPPVAFYYDPRYYHAALARLEEIP